MRRESMVPQWFSVLATGLSLSSLGVRSSVGSVLVLLALAANAQPPVIRGTLSNFDVHNWTQWPAVDLELEGIPHWALLDYYKGRNSWGLHPLMHYLSREPNRPIVEIDWTDPFRPIPHCETRHFGVKLEPGASPRRVRAWWSKKVERIPIPWQWWTSTDEGVIDIIDVPEDAPGPVTIRREYAYSPVPVSLEDLIVDLIEVTLPDGTSITLEWTPAAGDPVTLNPGETVQLLIPPRVDAKALLVRYPVTLEGRDEPDLRFINEAILGSVPAGSPPPITGSLSNFDVHNFTNHPVEDFELDLMCLEPTDAIKTYPSRWGMPARINAIPGGTEVIWADPDNPWPPSQTFHFGVSLRPGTRPRRVYGSFTRKIPIPVPWQTWELADPTVVIDIIRLDDLVPGPVRIQRERARIPEAVPLEELNWDVPVENWELVDAAPVELQPGGELILDLNLSGSQGDDVWLIRYTVVPSAAWPGSSQDEIVTRFVNEAVVTTPTVGSPQITGSLSNFDVHNVTGSPVHDLELQLEGVRKHEVAGWYTGPGAWGIQPGEHRIGDDQWEIIWEDPSRPIPHCTTRHFGVRTDPAWATIPAGAAPPELYAWWSIKAVPIQLPWQWWEPLSGGVVDIIRPSVPPEVEPVEGTRLEQPFLLQRKFAILQKSVPLDELMPDNPNIDLQPIDPEPFVVDSFFDITYQIDFQGAPGEPPPAAAVVEYSMQPVGSNQVDVRVINEVLLAPGDDGLIPRITGSLSNFEVHNWLDLDQFKFGDLELDIWDIDPYEVLDWYRGPRAWGNPPRIDQIPRGTEVMWADPWDPVEYCQTPQFGIRLLPEAVPSRVLAFWSLKLPIPVPWQSWRPEDGRVVDIVRLGPRYPGPKPVTITREYTTITDPIPLSALNWDATDNLPWQAGDTRDLNPGDTTELPIPVAAGDAAVLVRYEVRDPDPTGLPRVVTRFINEAEIEIPPEVPPPEGPECLIEECDVIVKWTNPVTYDTIQVARDGTVIADLPGAEQEHRDPIAAAGSGGHDYCVRGILNDELSDAVCCTIQIPPVLPPEELACLIENCRLIISFKDGSDYDKKRIEVDGTVVREIPGPHPAGQPETVTFAIPEDISVGRHTICVIGEWCGLESDLACCEVVIGQPGPPEEHQCTFELWWVILAFENASDYDVIRIYMDGNSVKDIPGPHRGYDLETHQVEYAPGGFHTFCVTGMWCGLESDPTCCEVEVPPGPEPPSDPKCYIRDCDIVVESTNGANYDEKTIYRDGILSAVIPGPHLARNREGWDISNAVMLLGPGTYDYCVAGVVSGVESARTCCKIEIKPPAPHHSMECSAEPFDIPCMVKLAFVNGAEYFTLRVYDSDGETIRRYPGPHHAGDAETVWLFVDGPGTYSYCVTGIDDCGLESDPACCQVEVTEAQCPSENEFIRGDSNATGAVDLSDGIYILQYLFTSGPPPPCLDAADANDDGAVDIADAIAVLSYLFAGAGDLPEPFGECGIDPTVDELGCSSFPPCE